MNKLLIILPIIGIVFLIIFWVIDPLTGPGLSVITIPFMALTLVAIMERKKGEKELAEKLKIFQAEKDEIIKDVQRKEKIHEEQYQALRSFSRDLAASLNKEQLMRVIVSTFSKLTHSPSGDSQCFLLSHDDLAHVFKYEAGDNFDSTTLKASSFSAEDDLLKTIIKSKKIRTFLSDIFGGDSNIGYFLKEERITCFSQLGSLALIPLILENEVWGIVVIFCHESAAARINNEQSFYLLLVAQASIALGSAIHRGLASIDRLTQLYNRTFLQKRMNEETEFCNRQLLPLSVLMIDIDHFKEINDTYGHQEGDMVLKKIARIISNCVRLTDLCARYGGEEFVVVLPGIAENSDDKFSIAERLRVTVENTDFIILGEKRLKVTISAGVTIRKYPEDKETGMEELIIRADRLLYKAKNDGRNCVRYDA
ncbi:MAG: GGDEF domain-containing protein [Candidatus Omnitrophica bacterium]|nr:GGDEF domain-containing protein [Candidatus Omnitrophota bacterium]